MAPDDLVDVPAMSPAIVEERLEREDKCVEPEADIRQK
jgi:hypothetical protein